MSFSNKKIIKIKPKPGTFIHLNSEENLIKKTKSHTSIYVFCDLYPKLQIQLQQFTESYSDFDCYWMESMGNLNF